MRVKLTLAYDGTAYCGWAPSEGQPTIHRTLTEAIRNRTGQELEITGASRTDSGAHAQGQVCHFDTDLPIETEKWPRILNRVLPPDIVVLRAEAVGAEFHARFCAEDRSYRYRIRRSPDPFLTRFVHVDWREFDYASMREAARLIVGTHDFRAFTQALDPAIGNTTRTIRSAQVSEVGDETWIDVTGTAFLRGMMRRIAGGLVEVGRGQRTLEEFESLLSKRCPERHWPVVLPAKGLCLMRVRYGDPPRDCRPDRSGL